MGKQLALGGYESGIGIMSDMRLARARTARFGLLFALAPHRFESGRIPSS